MNRLISLLLACAAIGCTPTRLVAPLRPGPRAPANDEPFRASAPPLPPVVEAIDAPPRTTTLPNGLRVVFVPRHNIPLVVAELVIDRSSFDVGDAGGLDIAQTAHLFGHGGSRAPWNELSATAEATGSSWSTRTTTDFLTMKAQGPSPSFDWVLHMVATTAIEARLSDEDYKKGARVWGQMASAHVISVALGEKRVLFGHKQAYGAAGSGEKVVSLGDAQAIHDRLFQPAQAILIVVGDVTPEAVDDGVARAFGGWKGRVLLPRVSTQAPYENGPRVSTVSHYGLEQLRAAVFARGPEASSRDAVVFQILAQVAGGAVSKLLEEPPDAGDAHARGAFVVEQRGATWMSISAAYASTKALDGVRRVLTRIADVRAGNVTDEEIATAREVLEARWRQRMESISGAAEAYSEDAAFGLERVREYPGRVAKVTKEDLVRVANGYLSPSALHVLFLGEDRWLNAESLGMGGATALDLSK